jgi:pimeloyl-ACP methyl ester carboxylesterase
MDGIQFEEETVRIGGAPVRYRVAGAGPPVMLVHGLAGSWRWWQPIAEPLASQLRLYVVDLPGFGSGRRRRFTLADAPSFLRSMLAALELERVHLVGHSLGALLCARTAARAHDTVDRLVLIAPAGFLPKRRLIRYCLPLAAALRRTRPAFLRVVLADSLRAGAPTLYRASTELLRDVSPPGELAAISCPTLLIWGDQDPLVPPRIAERFLRAIPNAQLAQIAHAGHTPMAERPREVADAILHFLNDRGR